LPKPTRGLAPGPHRLLKKAGENFRTSLHKRKCRMGEGEASCQTRRFDAGGILCVFQGKAPKYGGKRPAQAALIACEYRFLYRKAARKAARTLGVAFTKYLLWSLRFFDILSLVCKTPGRRSFFRRFPSANTEKACVESPYIRRKKHIQHISRYETGF